MPSKNILIIFIKYPQPGSVKTRLAKSIGNSNAARLYKIFCEIILNNTQHKSFQRVLFYAPGNKKRAMESWLGTQTMILQKGKNLGQKIAHSFRYAFKNGAKRVVVIGTDSPFITKRTLVKAFKVLEKKQCVVGPSQDGGYYLIGLSKYREDIFRNIKWSTSKVLSQTSHKLYASKVAYVFLEKNFDVDDKEGLKLLYQRLQSDNSLGMRILIRELKGMSRLFF